MHLSISCVGSTYPLCSRHLNVAKFVGVIQGYSGLDGIVVTMDGIDFYDFLSGTHSGAGWAKCAFAGSAPGWTNAERITVDRDGHVVIFPGRSGRMNTNFHEYAYERARPQASNSVELIIQIYARNCTSGLAGLRAFIDVLANLEPGFTELQILKIAADCKMFPDDDSNFYGHGCSPLPLFQPNVGEFGQARYSNGELVSWKKLGRLRRIQDTDLGFPSWSSGLDYYKSLVPGGTEWVTPLTEMPATSCLICAHVVAQEMCVQSIGSVPSASIVQFGLTGTISSRRLRIFLGVSMLT
ncbi:hypothetical protein BDV93DRAFT_523902 [Ceratobasidium sp. AG-I]|nr:hypothetical protein BDV93DRAFT_523902 [Ceratobasidium sp. AG-I]